MKPNPPKFGMPKFGTRNLTGFLAIALLLSLFLCLWPSGARLVRADSVSERQLQEIRQQWQQSAHAFADVNCSSCHTDKETKKLVVRPSHESCRTCHEKQVETFLIGKHGVRVGEGLSPLTPAMARLPMKAAAREKQMNCNTCHDAHSVDTFQASVDSCLTCHDDLHSRNYLRSPHGSLFTQAGKPSKPSEDLVTCATCHLPRQQTETSEFAFVNHNNTYTLLPRDRMVKEVCTNCHGMEFAYNSIFDDSQVEANFDRPPERYLKTLEMIREFEKKRSGSSASRSEDARAME